jgi:hypothetical protein
MTGPCFQDLFTTPDKRNLGSTPADDDVAYDDAGLATKEAGAEEGEVDRDSKAAAEEECVDVDDGQDSLSGTII